MIIPDGVRASCGSDPTRLEWLHRLRDSINELTRRWGVTLGAPYDDASCSWVAPAKRRDGSAVVLKIGMPHFEAEHEIAGLRFWDGDPMVRLLDADEDGNAMLLEHCEPGTTLRALSTPEQDAVIAALIRRCWRRLRDAHPFRPLSTLMAYWRAESMSQSARWPDAGLVTAGLRLFDELSRTAERKVLLATDLHAGNVLRAEREPWLVIDPKPFVGDPAFDATQHLLNGRDRLRTAPHDTIRRFSDLLGVDQERVGLWLFARLAGEPRAVWDERTMALARALTP